MEKKKSTSSVPLESVSTSLWCCCGMHWCWCANLVWSSYLFVVLVSLRTIYLIINMYFEKKNRERIVIGKKMLFSFFSRIAQSYRWPQRFFPPVSFKGSDQVSSAVCTQSRGGGVDGGDGYIQEGFCCCCCCWGGGGTSVQYIHLQCGATEMEPFTISITWTRYISHPTTAAAGEGSPRGRASSLIPSHRALPALG